MCAAGQGTLLKPLFGKIAFSPGRRQDGFPSRFFPAVVPQLFGAIAQLWSHWLGRRRAVVLYPYVNLNTWSRLVARVLVPLVVALACVVYGFFFALTAPYLIIPFVVPVGVLALLSIWALPETNSVPVRAMESCFSALLIGLILWPNYLALTLPGLPWITMIRLTSFPMAFFLMVCLSMSPQFRARIGETAASVPGLLNVLLLFSINACVSLPFSHNLGSSIDRFVIQQINWMGVFLVSVNVFRTPRRAERYVALLLLLAIPVAAVAVLEFNEQHVLWNGHVPSFLRVEDPGVQRALMDSVRGATGQFRAKATFSTALGLAEYISLMTPFALYWAVSRHGNLKRAIGLAMLPTIYVIVRMTDSRLGVLGYLISIVTYVFLWSLIRWRRRLNDIAAAAIVYLYPAAFLCILAASMFVHKIHVLIFGGGAQSASNLARQEQYRMAFRALAKNPVGHGTGQAGLAIGYGSSDFIAIDSYYIAIALDYGIIGLILYASIFFITLISAVRIILKNEGSNDSEMVILIPLVSCLAAFLMIRSVFGQPDIHPMIFALLGMTVALIARARSKSVWGIGEAQKFLEN